MNPSLPDILTIVCILMSLLTFCMMAADKAAAKRHIRRTPEKLLFLFAFLFGAPGGTLGMYLFRHKTKHAAFFVGFPLLTLLQLLLLIILP